MKAGDKVTWTSQAMGCVKKKTGTVIADVPAGFPASALIPANVRKSHIKYDVDKSANNRTLVAVPAGKDGRITHYYCPRTNLLKGCGDE